MIIAIQIIPAMITPKQNDVMSIVIPNIFLPFPRLIAVFFLFVIYTIPTTVTLHKPIALIRPILQVRVIKVEDVTPIGLLVDTYNAFKRHYALNVLVKLYECCFVHRYTSFAVSLTGYATTLHDWHTCFDSLVRRTRLLHLGDT